MRRLGAIASIVIFALLSAAPAAHANKRVALVIGNSAYQHTPKLDNPKNDAADMTATLKKHGFEVIDGLDLDKAAFDRKVRDFAVALKGSDAGVFFYAGHGLQVAGQNYLVPVDAKAEEGAALDLEMVRVDVVHRIMERQTETNILFLDACRDNPLARNLARSMGTRSAEIGRGLGRIEAGVGTLISFSTQPGNVALDGTGRNSPFTGALVKHLGAPKEDLSAILIDVRNDVMRATKNKQVPWEHVALRARFYFSAPTPAASTPASLPLAGEAAERAWALVKDSPDLRTFDAFRKQYGVANPLYDRLAEARIEQLNQAATALKGKADAEAEAKERERLALQQKQHEEKKRADDKRKTEEAAKKKADAEAQTKERERLALLQRQENERKRLEAKRETEEAAQRFVLKAADVHPLGYPTVEAVVRMGKKLEAATGGRVSVQMFPSMQLGGEKEMIEQAQVGALQLGRVSLGPMGPIVPELSVFNLPFVFRDTSHMEKVIDGPIGDELLKKLSDHPTAGLIGLGWMSAGTRNVYNSKHPIKTVQDLKGLKIRMMGNPVFIDTMGSLGGNGMAMGYDQLISGLQTGVIDGAENNEPSYATGQHYRYAKYYSKTGHLMIPDILVFSRKSWNLLSKADQDLIMKFAKEAQREQRGLWYEMEMASLATMKKAGVQINEIADRAPFQAAVKPVWEKYGAQHTTLLKRIQDVK